MRPTICDSPSMAKSRGKQFWERLVREVAAGGSRTAVARRHGVSQTWLGKWCRELGGAPRAATLLPVRVVEEHPRRLELAVGALSVRFEEGTDPEYVAALARALGS